MRFGELGGEATHNGYKKFPNNFLTSTKIKNLTGPGLTDTFRMAATDLGIPIRTPDGRLLFVFGDTFEGPAVGDGWWRSPVGLYSTTTDLNSGVTWSSAVGGTTAQQFWDYEHNNAEFSTVLPSDVIVIGKYRVWQKFLLTF